MRQPLDGAIDRGERMRPARLGANRAGGLERDRDRARHAVAGVMIRITPQNYTRPAHLRGVADEGRKHLVLRVGPRLRVAGFVFDDFDSYRFHHVQRSKPWAAPPVDVTLHTREVRGRNALFPFRAETRRFRMKPSAQTELLHLAPQRHRADVQGLGGLAAIAAIPLERLFDQHPLL